MAHREQCVGKTDEWYTPPHVFDAMGVQFTMDVASPGKGVTPWIPAEGFVVRDSLNFPWSGFVWMNPPFGGRNGLIPWLDKFVSHADGVCLVPDRTSAPWWQIFARKVDMILFCAPKIKFIGAAGFPLGVPAQGTCLFSVGARGAQALRNAQAMGLGFLMKSEG